MGSHAAFATMAAKGTAKAKAAVMPFHGLVPRGASRRSQRKAGRKARSWIRANAEMPSTRAVASLAATVLKGCTSLKAACSAK